MRKTIAAVISGALGVFVCLGIAGISQFMQVTPKFPAPGGEDDFAVRATIFFFGVCPAFAVLGIWIAVTADGVLRPALRMWIGVFGGSSFVFVLVAAARTMIENLTTAGAGNRGALAFFIAWFLGAVAGAYLVKRRTGTRNRKA